jgi:hypothetical protein
MGFIYLTSIARREQLPTGREWDEKPPANLRCYHHYEMKAQTIGRVLGTGLRVAGRIISQRLAGDDHSATAGSAANATGGAQAAGWATGSLARGVAGFLRPFRRLGGILWLEVTGVFFFLPVAVFAPTLWRTRLSCAHGPDHRLFLVTAAVMAVFFYLSMSSFWRARKR